MKKISASKYNLQFDNLPKDFDNFKIAQISDLHNANFKGDLEKLIEKEAPDIIVITGDIAHKENSYQYALEFVKNVVKLAPVYYVNGNHELRFKDYKRFKSLLQDSGVTVLDNETQILTRGDSKIALIGINDPNSFKEHKIYGYKKMLGQLCSFVEGEFKILLAHRPEHFLCYINYGIELTFAGHAHGGQFFFPFKQALFAPNQGFFPKYIKGVKHHEGRYMIVSRGLGRNVKVPRWFNRPEVVFAQLTSK